MQGKDIYQYLSNRFQLHVYVAYTHKSNPTTTYKLYLPFKDPERHKHDISNMRDYDTFLYSVHRDGLIFFARMGKTVAHIDPWMTNANECFDAGNRNSVVAIFPESQFGNCLTTAIKSELARHNITLTDLDLQIVESFCLIKNS